jgi:hypothetical protein
LGASREGQESRAYADEKKRRIKSGACLLYCLLSPFFIQAAS